jgi:hypothetical protein
MSLIDSQGRVRSRLACPGAVLRVADGQEVPQGTVIYE